MIAVIILADSRVDVLAEMLKISAGYTSCRRTVQCSPL